MADEVDRRIAEAQAAAKDPAADWVRVRAIAPFEIAAIFAEWQRRADAGELDVFGIGPPSRMTAFGLPIETIEQFGDRIARGVFQLLKEV